MAESASALESLGNVAMDWQAPFVLFDLPLRFTRPPVARQSLNSLLIAADEIIHRRPVRNRKLWINRQRPRTQQLKQWARELGQISSW